MNNRDIEDIYPLSPMQQGMLFHSIYAPETAVYLEQLNCRLVGVFNVSAFQRAWQEVVNRHTILRTSFMWEDLDEPLQIVHRHVDVPLNFQDISDIPQESQQELLAETLTNDLQLGFNLIEAPLLRLTLVKLGPDHHFLIWTNHHLLLDGWSLPILLKEVFALYEAYNQEKELYLRPAYPYRNYIGWLKKQDLGNAETFWRNYLQGFSAPTPLVVSHDDPHRRASVAIEKASFGAELTQQLRKSSQQIGVTLNSWLQGAWGMLLSRYSHEDDVVFGATVAGRPAALPGIDAMLGLFINTLPVRLQIMAGLSVKEWLKSLQAQQAETRQYEYSPLVQIQSWSEVAPGQPLFESILVFENYPVEESLKEQRGSLQILDVRHQGKTNYPLTIVVAPGSILEVHIVYDPGMFAQATIERMLGHLKQILSSMLEDVSQSLDNVVMLTPAEEELIITTWNQPNREIGRSSLTAFSDLTIQDNLTTPLIVDLFEAQAMRNPHTAAVILSSSEKSDTALTYLELKERVDLLSGELKGFGVGPEVLVGLSFERSIEMVVAILAVLKAGGAYVPLDPKYPAERLSFMLEDAGIQLLLTTTKILSNLGETIPKSLEKLQVICLNEKSIQGQAGSDQNPSPIDPSAAAYVIYTSGSTGQPKGVVIEHHSLANHAICMAEALELGVGQRMVQLISLSFDAAAEEIFPTLISGATLVLPEPELEISGPGIYKFLVRYQISVLHLPVPLWNTIVDELANSNMKLPPSLSMVLVGGESPTSERLKKWGQAAVRQMGFINAYGPTEATITTTYFKSLLYPDSNPEVDLAEISTDLRIPIGKPIPNAQIYILDGALRPVPIGVSGEIYIAGAGLARGYLNRAELTVEKFVPNPFLQRTAVEVGQVGERLYRTGDLGKYLPDGNIVFGGRADNQVKIRGFRIELEEIEAVLTQAPGVKDGIAIVREDNPGDKRLVAYFEGIDSQAVNLEAIRSYLKERLPEFMLPGWMINLPALPRLPSGKIDRRAVARLSGPDAADLGNVIPLNPSDAIEEIIAGLWIEVLSIQFPGVQANFFELGGHSLKATQLLSRIQQTFSIDLPLRTLFDSPTIAGMAAAVRIALSGDQAAIQPIQPVERDSVTGLPLIEPPLSFSQQRLWFLDQLDPGNLSYNIPATVFISGDLNIPALEQSLNQIIQHHESLRTVFVMRNDHPVQIILPEQPIQIDRAADVIVNPERLVQNLLDQEVSIPFEIKNWVISQVQIPFDLAKGPLIRAAILRIDEHNHILIITIHHIVSDGWSMGVLIGEIMELYAANQLPATFSAPAALLQPQELQFADYAAWQRLWLSGEELNRQLAYWKNQLSGAPPLLDLPTDHPRPAIKTSRGSMLSFTLSAELSKAIQSMARQEGVTVYMFLLAAFQTLLYRYSGQDDISVGSAIANRTRPEVQGIIGFFVNTLVLRTDLSGEPGFRELLQRVRETTLGAFAHQDLPFETLVEAIQPQRNLSYTPLFQVGFDLQEVPIRNFELSNLKILPLNAHAGTASFDLLMSINQSPGLLSGSVEFNTDLFEPMTIQGLLDHFEKLLNSITADPDQSIANLPILTDFELNKILLEWNSTEQPFSNNQCIHQLFELHAAQHPDSIALDCYSIEKTESQPDFVHREISYFELNRQANMLATVLSSLGVGPDILVGISTERSIEMVVGILGILKAGGAYLPLDPNYPADRLSFMLQDSQVQTVVTQSSVLERIGQLLQGYQVINLEPGWEQLLSSRILENPLSSEDVISAENPACLGGPENLAYIIYTSGSTGKPKGTLLQHRGLCNLVEWQRRTFEIDASSRVLQFSPFSFDASVWETFMALANGASLCLAPQDVLASGIDLIRLLKKARITTITLPPSVLSIIPGESVTAEKLPDLRTVIAAGEACPHELVVRWSPGRKFFDAYGPTETTVCASAGLIDPEASGNPPIGKPIANFQLYVVDQHLQPVPIGVPGELLIGGIGLARGYHLRPELSSEKFINNPLAAFLRKSGFVERGRQRVYRTGDLVRYRNDGSLEFLGRIDQQVKVRGYRIELGEIESIMQQFKHPVSLDSAQPPDSMPFAEIYLRDVAVVVRQDQGGDKRIVAFIVPELKQSDSTNSALAHAPALDQQFIDEATLVSALRSFVRKSLPEYMIPSGFVIMEALPLSPSGKIDRKALETQFVEQIGRGQSGAVYEAPRNETERELCRICADLLGIAWEPDTNSPIGVYDNFFELGGHSLMATQFISRIRDLYQVELPLRTIFEHPTVAELSEKIEILKLAGAGRQAPSIQPVSREARRMRQTTTGLSSSVSIPQAGASISTDQNPKTNDELPNEPDVI